MAKPAGAAFRAAPAPAGLWHPASRRSSRARLREGRRALPPWPGMGRPLPGAPPAARLGPRPSNGSQPGRAKRGTLSPPVARLLVRVLSASALLAWAWGASQRGSRSCPTRNPSALEALERKAGVRVRQQECLPFGDRGGLFLTKYEVGQKSV